MALSLQGSGLIIACSVQPLGSSSITAYSALLRCHCNSSPFCLWQLWHPNACRAAL